jgi:hypothetical protein
MNASATVIPMNISANANEFNEIGLASKAMLVSLVIRKPGGTKKDKEASKETAQQHYASEEAVSVNKRLWSKEAMSLFAKPASAADKAYREMTVPWSKAGRIFVSKDFDKIDQELKVHERAFWAGVEEFLAHIEQHMREAREAAGTLYDPNDYTETLDNLRAKFGFEVLYLPVPVEGDFRAQLSNVELDRVKTQLTSSLRKSYATAIREPWERLHEVTKIMSERLQAFDEGETKVIRQAIVDNVEELVGILPQLNIGDDPDLQKLANEVREKLTGHTKEELRDDNALRRRVKMDSSELARKVDAYLGLL